MTAPQNCILCEEAARDEQDAMLCCPKCHDRVVGYYEGGTIKFFIRWLQAIQRGDPRLYKKVESTLSDKVKSDIEHTIRHRRALLFNPLRYQKHFYNSTSRNLLAFWANQTGKSSVLAMRMRNWLTCDYPDDWPEEIRYEPPTIGRLWVPIFLFMQSVYEFKFIEWFDDWPNDHHTNEVWDIARNNQRQINRITYIPNGSTMDVVSKEQYMQNSDIAEGWQGHWAAADEPLDENAFNATKRGLIRRGGQFIYGGTLVDQEPWMVRAFLRNQRPGITECSFAEMDDNAIDKGGFLSHDNIEEAVALMTKKERDARRRGIPMAVSGAYFPMLNEPEFLDKVFVEFNGPIPDDWEVVTATDYHQGQPIFTIWAAIDPQGRYHFFTQLILDKVTPGTYVDAMMAVEKKWKVNRIKTRYVDRTIDRNYNSEIEDEYVLFNPYEKFLEHFNRWGTRDFEKVTGAEGNIDLVREMFEEPLRDVNTGEELQRIIIGHECEDLRETLPDYSPATIRSGPMKGMPNEKADKRKARGAHSIDCMLYLIGGQFKWSTPSESPPRRGTVGHIINEMLNQTSGSASSELNVGSSVSVSIPDDVKLL